MNKNLLVFDIDNTLFNWVDSVVPAIRAMVGVASDITGIPIDEITNSLRAEHQRRHSVEHPYSLADSEIIKAHFDGTDFKARKEALREAFEAFDRVRSTTLSAYDGVHDVLSELHKRYNLVAYTESSVIGSSYRLQALELEGYFDHVYCGDIAVDQPERERFSRALGLFDQDKYVLLDPSLRKPSPEVLFSIQEKMGEPILQYIGDSLYKDVKMAQQANVTGVWAKYGTHHKPENSSFLVTISHWSETEIAEFKSQANAEPPTPDIILERSICELLPILPE